MLNRYRPALVITVLLMLLAGATRPPRTAEGQAGRIVLAFYYTWYSSDLWSGGKTSDAAAQPYNSADPAAIARQVDQARGAGIDGFVASWYGPDGGANNQTQSNFLKLLDIAAARGFKAAVDFETYGPFFSDTGSVVNALKYAVGTLGAHPAYLRYAGKPVIFFWANNRFSPDQWASIRQQADPNHNSIWIAEGVTAQWLNVFDGLHLYNVAWSSDFAATATKFAGVARGLGKVWVATAMPGWDDTRVPGRAGAYAKDRAGGQFYRNSFNGAAASNPDMLIITSFNEWMEGSQIEPGVSYGNLYLDLTRQLAAAYKQGSAPQPPQAAPAPVRTAPTATTAPPTPTVHVPPPTETSLPDTPTPTPSPTSEFATPVAYVAAVPLEPTATPRSSATPTPQPSATTILVTLAPEKLAAASPDPAQPPATVWLAAAGAALIAGAAGVGALRRRRNRL